MKTKFTFVLVWSLAMAFTFRAGANVMHHCPPSNLTAVVTEGPAYLHWNHPVSVAACEPITGFEIRVRTCSNGNHSTEVYYVADGSDPVTMSLEMSPGTTCSWKVRSVSFYGSPQERNSIWVRGPDIGTPSERLDPWDEEDVFDQALIYPNPVFNTTMCVKINSWNRSSAQLSVVGVSGQVVYTEMLPIEPGSNYGDIDLSGLQAGVYFVRVSDRYKTRTTKIIKL